MTAPPSGQPYGAPPPLSAPYGPPPPAAAPASATPVPSAFPSGTDPNLVACFQAAGCDNSGTIDDKGLQSALSGNNHSLSLGTVDMLMSSFTDTIVRRIGPSEFIYVFCILQNWKSIFEKFDQERSSEIDGSELSSFYQSVVDLFVSKFFKREDMSKAERYDNFIQCCLTVKSKEETTCSGSATSTVPSAAKENLWDAVTIDCSDFSSWTMLIQEIEKVDTGNIMEIRKVYDEFLKEFPLCVDYWKKYADHEKYQKSVDKVTKVYERAVLFLEYSVELWCCYCQYMISTAQDADVIRRLFERALAIVGTDYRSNILWDEYIKYEESLHAWSCVANIYSRTLEQPIQEQDRYFKSFKNLVMRHGLCKIDGIAVDNPEEYISIREKMHKKSRDCESSILGFEHAITRQKFDVKPLDKGELENWHTYLNFVEKGQDREKIAKFYGRCIISCANYSEFWIRYVKCMEEIGKLDVAEKVLNCATTVHVKNQVEIHLFSAKFKELNGNTLGAREVYDYISEKWPGLLEAVVQKSNMEYRLGDINAAIQVYESAIAVEKEKPDSNILPALLIEYCRFTYTSLDDLEKAKNLLTQLEGHKITRPIIEAAILLESVFPLNTEDPSKEKKMYIEEERIKYLDSLVGNFLEANQIQGEMASSSDKEEISTIFLEFLHRSRVKNGRVIQWIKQSQTRHRSFFSCKKITVTRKRSAEQDIMSLRAKVPKNGDVVQSVICPSVCPQLSEVSEKSVSTADAPQSANRQYDANSQLDTSSSQATVPPDMPQLVSRPPTPNSQLGTFSSQYPGYENLDYPHQTSRASYYTYGQNYNPQYPPGNFNNAHQNLFSAGTPTNHRPQYPGYANLNYPGQTSYFARASYYAYGQNYNPQHPPGNFNNTHQNSFSAGTPTHQPQVPLQSHAQPSDPNFRGHVNYRNTGGPSTYQAWPQGRPPNPLR